MPVAPVGAPAAAAPTLAERPPSQSFGALLEARRAAPAAPAPPAPARPPLAVLRGIEEAQRRLDGVLEAARRGKTFTAQELLALQATAYRYAQTVDIAARVAEHGAQSVKQAVNAQV